MSAGRRPRSERVFALLLELFPRSFRDVFGEDMREVFRDQLKGARERAGGRGVAAFWLRTVAGVAGAALVERWLVLRARRARATARRGDGVFRTFAADVRFAGRVLRRSPASASVAVLAIALGTGAVATVFSAVNAFVLRPLPGARDADRLVLVERQDRTGTSRTSASYPYYEYLRDATRTLDDVGAWTRVDLSISPGGAAITASGNIVSGNYFSVLGVRPALGRFFAPEEDRTPLTHPVLVVSYDFWRSALGADAGAVGRTVGVNGRPYTLIGVAPPGFRGAFTPLVTDAWVPLRMQPHLRPGRDLDDAAAPWLWVFGRMRDGAVPDAVRAELQSLTDARTAQGVEPAWFAEADRIRLTPMTGLPDDARRALLGFAGILLGAAALVLLIAGANVAGILSARALARRREMVVRAALGAGRGRLVRQLLTENLILFLLGGAGGLALAVLATDAFERIHVPADVAITLELSPDLRVFCFTLALALAAGIAFGLVPALRGARTDLAGRLRDGTAGAGTRARFAGRALIVGQLALSLTVLVAAGLLVRALDHGRRIDPGFTLDGVALASFNAEAWGYDETRSRAFFDALDDRVAALPGVAAAAYTGIIPLSFQTSGSDIHIDGPGAATGRDDAIAVSDANVGPRYFDVLGLPILRGRAFRDADDEAAPDVAIVNETLARRIAADGDVVGRTFRSGDRRLTIVGVARDAKYASLAEDAHPFVYLPIAQRWQPRRTLLIRARTSSDGLAIALRDAVRDLDPAVPPPVLAPLREASRISLLPQRVAALFTGAVGAAGLLLAAVGLYGVIALAVSRRTREIGIRVALGAARRDILQLFLHDALRLAAAGILLGSALAAAATRLLASLLFGIDPLDPTTFATAAALLTAIALLASYLPARRAASALPTETLRTE